MSLTISETDLSGFKALRLDNGLVQADLMPSLGGKIWNLTHKPRAVQWIWHNPHLAPAIPPRDASYDDSWAGGWEELFPNDAPGTFDGRELPDHGEWWSRPWDWEIAEDSARRAAVLMRLEGRSVKARCEKRVSLAADSSRLDVSYRVENLEAKELRFLFKQHLAIAVGPRHRLELPGGKVAPVDLNFSTRLKSAGPFEWPGSPDLSRLPPADEGQREFVYVSELAEGWCGARDERTGARLRMHFDRRIFPHVWLFMTFGGWRGLYVVVLEPCTNIPKDLSRAMENGTCATLGSRKTLECAVSVELS